MNTSATTHPDWLNLKKAGEYLGLDWRTVKRLTQVRQIPSTRLSGVRVLVHRAACDLFLQRMKGVEAAAPTAAASILNPPLPAPAVSNRAGRWIAPERWRRTKASARA